MAERRYCQRCASEVRCREERTVLVPGTDRAAVHYYCPKCDQRLGSHYGTL